MAKIREAVIIPNPPEDQASVIGSFEMRTAATPPTAAKPIVPTLNKPAYPHWMLTPNAIIADIRQRLKIESITDQD